MIIGHTGETHMATSFEKRPIRRGEGEYLRSNRPLTEFACTHLGLFLTGHYRGTGQRVKGNTLVTYEIEKRMQLLKVYLFDEEILSILLAEWKAASVRVSFTNFYDGDGQPTTTTSERLNGLLDRLGAYGILPKGTRVFRDPGEGLTYLGRGDDKVAVGKEYAESIYIRPHSTDLDIVGTELSYEVE
jgi:hypothetical protein